MEDSSNSFNTSVDVVKRFFNNQGIWEPTEEEKKYFDHLFKFVDKRRYGYVEGEEANNFLKTSGLPEEIISLIWELCGQAGSMEIYPSTFPKICRFVALAQNGIALGENVVM